VLKKCNRLPEILTKIICIDVEGYRAGVGVQVFLLKKTDAFLS